MQQRNTTRGNHTGPENITPTVTSRGQDIKSCDVVLIAAEFGGGAVCSGMWSITI